MAHLTYEKTHSIIRMTADDRQSINRIIQHKCEEFEAIIKKGVVAMLNAQEERDKLFARRSEYLNFMTHRSKQKKEQINQIAQTIRENTASAPMGAGAATQLVTTASAAIGNAIIDNNENKRQQTEVEQNLYSAQMLYYIPPQDYERIAESVAKVLSYRYQFLIFRLAAGENGYIKLALFFISSMKTFAIARLREQKSNIIKALLNAAIPPSTDSISYRDWPSIDFENFRSHLTRVGTRKTLELDEDVNDILRRCGPAVRALLGGVGSYVCYDTGKVIPFSPYTIIGALNHAPILGSDKRIITGLTPRHRQYIKLDGNSKYPLILLGHDEKTADLGVNFATKITNEILNPSQIEALRRLVPNFFSEQDDEQDLIKYRRAPADFRYPEEKFECPWSAKREHEWKSRLQKIYPLPTKNTFANNEEDFDDSTELLHMQKTAYEFNLEYKKRDALDIKAQILDALVQTYNDPIQKKHALYLGKYAAYAAKEWVRCLLETSVWDVDELELARGVIESANLSIFASRDCPNYETEKYETALNARKKALKYLEVFDQVQNINQKNYTLILEYLEETQGFKKGIELASREAITTLRLNKYYKSQINDGIQRLLKMQEISRSMSYFNYQEDMKPHTINDFYQQLSTLQNLIGLQPLQTIQDVLEAIDFYHQEIMLYSEYLKNMLHSRNIIILDMESSEALIKIQEVIDNSLKIYEESNLLKSQNNGWGHRYQQKLQNLISIKDCFQTNRQTLIELKNKLQYRSIDAESDLKINQFFIRTCIQAEFYMLLHLSNYNQFYNFNSDAFQQLYLIARQLHIQLQSEYATDAEIMYNTIHQKFSRLPRDIELAEIFETYRKVKNATDELELSVRDDTELVDIALNQTRLAFREAEKALQDVYEFESKLQYIYTHCEPQQRKINSNGLNLDRTNEQFLKAIENNFQELLQNTNDLLSETVKSQLELEFKHFQSSYINEQTLDLRYLGIRFLSNISRIISESLRESLHLHQNLELFKAHIQNTETALKSSQTELTIERKKTLKVLKQAYLKICSANQVQQRLIISEAPSLPIAWTLSTDTLSWASHLSISEQKWLDKKNTLQKKKLFEETKEHKSPVRMAYSLILALTMEQLKSKKHEVCRLKKIQIGVQKTKIPPLSLESVARTPSAKRSQFSEEKNLLLKIIQQKLLILEEQIEELETLQTNILAVQLKIFFNDWKSKTFESMFDKKNIQTQLGLIKKGVKESVDKKEPREPADKKESTLVFEVEEFDESQYSIDELERWLNILQQNICDNERLLTPQSIFSSSPSNDTLQYSESVEESQMQQKNAQVVTQASRGPS